MDYQLYHHGILGMHWGKQNGPPYPLGSSDHSSSEQRAGWRKSLSGKHSDSQTSSKKQLTSDSEKSYNKDEDTESSGFHLSDKQKTALKIGAAAAATALAAYGMYKLGKSGKLDGLISKGKEAAPSLFGSEASDGIKRLKTSETLADTLKNTNPNRGNPDYNYNCTLCSIASCMRQKGYDVTAGSTGGKGRSLSVAVEKMFNNAQILDGTAAKFGRSKADAAEMLVKRFGDNASGVCGIQWKGGNGLDHAFNWSIKDGVVTFFDSQSGKNDSMVSAFWNKIDTNGTLTLARLDNAEVNVEGIKKFLE